MSESCVKYSYVPLDWSQTEFLRLGGFVVVFLNYNKGSLVVDAVRSALEQDYPLLEMIFLDDNSTDGSGDEMERIVRTYRGRHKVMVVRNKQNQTIAGQWNIASKLASGTWLGMFCGDDVAFPNRVSVVAKLVHEYPTAWGICTNALIAGSDDKTFCANRKRGTWSGENGNLPPENMFGGMTFWNRAIFDTELPRCNMDDYLLQYMVMIRRSKEDSVSLVWALDINTVHYSLSGITNRSIQKARQIRCPILRIWSEGRAMRDFGQKYGFHVWSHVLDYDTKFGHEGRLREQIQGLSRLYASKSGGWWLRLKIFLLVNTKERMCQWGGVRNRVVRYVGRNFLFFSLGVVGYPIFAGIAALRLRILKKGK